MQTQSAQYIKAITAGSVTWAQTQLRADWDNSGSAGSAGVDNMDSQLGDSWAVSQSFDEGYPDDVRDTDGGGVSALTAPLNSGVHPLSLASQYFSPFRADSPLVAFDRDVAAMYLNAGAVPASGRAEYTRVFTGQMTDVAIEGKTATLSGVSASRLKMSTIVNFPAINGQQEGLNVSWPIMYALHQCGLHGTPPPRSNTRAWFPCAGSLREMLVGTLGTNTSNKSYLLTLPTQQTSAVRPTFVKGPYLWGVFAGVDTVREQWINIAAPVLASGSDFISAAGSTGRVELWVRGDTVNYSNPPSRNPWTYLFKCFIPVENTSIEVDLSVTTAYKVQVDIFDGTNHFTLTSVAAVPQDGAWHFIGGAYSFTEKKAWVNVDGTVTTSTFASLTTANLPVADVMSFFPQIISVLPIAEVQLSTGSAASPTNDAVWLNTRTWTQSVVLRRSYTELVALVEAEPREAFEFISRTAQGELSAIGYDEFDRFQYLPQSRWAEDSQQTPVDALSTDTNVSTVKVIRDPTRVRNSIRVTYTDSQVETANTVVAEVRETVAIPPSTTIVKIATSRPVIAYVQTLTPTDPTSATDQPISTSFYCLNSNSTGTGVWQTVSNSIGITATYLGSGPGYITYTFNNFTVSTWYLVVPNGSSWACLGVAGRGVLQSDSWVTVEDINSIANRGKRGLTVSAQQIQSADDATRVGQWLVDQLAYPVNRVEQLSVFGDPRRQPGDLVTISDAYNTGATGNYRIFGVEHAKQSAQFAQTLNVRAVTGTTGNVVADAESEGAVNLTGAYVDVTLVASDD